MRRAQQGQIIFDPNTLVDQINDALSKAKYNEIDKMFTAFFKEMFRSDKPDSELKWLAS